MPNAEHLLTRSQLHEVGGNMIRVMPHGPDRLERLIAVVEKADAKLSVVYYTFSPDMSGTRLRDALIAACERGVAVQMLIDSFGSNETQDVFFDPLRAAGASVRWFGTRWTPRYLIRNHQKLLIADDKIVVTGGFNVDDTYFMPADGPPTWQDMGLVINGPVVDMFVRWFNQLAGWMDAPRPRFSALRRLIFRFDPGDGPVRLLIGGPTARLSPWARTLRSLLAGAQHLSISVAYFSPNAGFIRRLGRVLTRGGTLNMVLPAHSDNSATIGASRLLYRYLLKRGARIAEFEPCRLHNKIVVIDDHVLIGSSNLDMRSLYVNMELMLHVEDAHFAAAIRAIIDAQAAQSTNVTPELHRQRSTLLNRIRWSLAWFAVGIVDYGVTRRLNFGLPAAK